MWHNPQVACYVEIINSGFSYVGDEKILKYNIRAIKCVDKMAADFETTVFCFFRMNVGNSMLEILYLGI